MDAVLMDVIILATSRFLAVLANVVIKSAVNCSRESPMASASKMLVTVADKDFAAATCVSDGTMILYFAKILFSVEIADVSFAATVLNAGSAGYAANIF